jgi:hypothetical protein
MTNRFVILLHTIGIEEHWDIMLEVDVGGCKQLDTWSIPPQSNLIKTNSNNTNCTISSFSCPAIKLPYHRIAYLDYEGEVSKNRGIVKRVDNGTYQKINNNKFRLHGKLLNGELTTINDNTTNNSCKIIFENASQENL